MNEQEHKSLIRKLVCNARAIISDQIGLSVGVRKMCKILLWLEPYDRELPRLIFSKYMMSALNSYRLVRQDSIVVKRHLRTIMRH